MAVLLLEGSAQSQVKETINTREDLLIIRHFVRHLIHMNMNLHSGRGYKVTPFYLLPPPPMPHRLFSGVSIQQVRVRVENRVEIEADCLLLDSSAYNLGWLGLG